MRGFHTWSTSRRPKTLSSRLKYSLGNRQTTDRTSLSAVVLSRHTLREPKYPFSSSLASSNSIIVLSQSLPPGHLLRLQEHRMGAGHGAFWRVVHSLLEMEFVDLCIKKPLPNDFIPSSYWLHKAQVRRLWPFDSFSFVTLRNLSPGSKCG
jgi:hypothetical protein